MLTVFACCAHPSARPRRALSCRQQRRSTVADVPFVGSSLDIRPPSVAGMLTIFSLWSAEQSIRLQPLHFRRINRVVVWNEKSSRTEPIELAGLSMEPPGRAPAEAPAFKQPVGAGVDSALLFIPRPAREVAGHSRHGPLIASAGRCAPRLSSSASRKSSRAQTPRRNRRRRGRPGGPSTELRTIRPSSRHPRHAPCRGSGHDSGEPRALPGHLVHDFRVKLTFLATDLRNRGCFRRAREPVSRAGTCTQDLSEVR